MVSESLINAYTENSSMHHHVGFSKIGSHISKTSRFCGSLYEISVSCWRWHFIMLYAGSYSSCKQFLVYYVSVVDASLKMFK